MANTRARLEHRYLTNCQLVTSMQGYYGAISLVYLILCGVWIYLTWFKYAGGTNETLALQKSLLAVPVLKLA